METVEIIMNNGNKYEIDINCLSGITNDKGEITGGMLKIKTVSEIEVVINTNNISEIITNKPGIHGLRFV